MAQKYTWPALLEMDQQSKVQWSAKKQMKMNISQKQDDAEKVAFFLTFRYMRQKDRRKALSLMK